MSGFDTAWLDLREPVDAASRNRPLAQQLAEHFASRPELHIADLGSGTGANMRWLAPRLPGIQHWHLLESDPALVAGMPQRLTAWANARGASVHALESGLEFGDGSRATWHAEDLAIDPLPDSLEGHGPLHLVTASALADLVSARWLTRLAQQCDRHGSAALLALGYDGRASLEPAHPLDTWVRNALNRHQLRDKGFGPALGPGAIAFTAQAFARRGYRVIQARSDWRLGPTDRALVAALLEGWRHAAGEDQTPDTQTLLDEWQSGHLRNGVGALRVGHVDLLALPGSTFRS